MIINKFYLMKELNIILDPEVSYGSLDDQHARTLIDRIRKGLSFKAFAGFAASSPFSMQDWARFLHLSERTLQRYRKQNKDFEPLQAEMIIQIALIYKQGLEVFGSQEAFDHWLSARHIAMGGIAPKELMDTMIGIQLVRDELERITHGVLS